MHVPIGPVSIIGERLQIERALVAESVVETLPGDTHRLHQGLGRGTLVAKAPKDAHRFGQRTLGIKPFLSRHTRLSNLPPSGLTPLIPDCRVWNAMVPPQSTPAPDEGMFDSDGLRIHFRAWNPSATPRAVVVIVPGFHPPSADYWWPA